MLLHYHFGVVSFPGWIQVHQFLCGQSSAAADEFVKLYFGLGFLLFGELVLELPFPVFGAIVLPTVD